MSETPNEPVEDGTLDEDIEEISVDITEEGLVWIHGDGWELVLAPEEARELGEALIDAAKDAEEPVTALVECSQ